MEHWLVRIYIIICQCIVYRVRASTKILSIKYTNTTNFSFISSSNCPALASKYEGKKNPQFIFEIGHEQKFVVCIYYSWWTSWFSFDSYSSISRDSRLDCRLFDDNLRIHQELLPCSYQYLNFPEINQWILTLKRIVDKS